MPVRSKGWGIKQPKSMRFENDLMRRIMAKTWNGESPSIYAVNCSPKKANAIIFDSSAA